MRDKILVVDDDPNLVELIRFNFEDEGYQVIAARDGEEGMRLLYSHRPTLLILDIAMPKLDGYEVCRRVREVTDIPIIMVTAKGRKEDIVKGLELGADDYVTKPFLIDELLARVRSVLRRASTGESGTDKTLIYDDDHLSIDLDTRRARIKGEIVKLTPTEYKLLAFLLTNKGRLLQSRQILESVWGFEYIDDIDYLRTYIWHLRRKLEPDPKNPIYLINELNIGYRFEPQN